MQTATRYRTIHGILAALAFVVLFPVGSIFMRLIPGRAAVWFHALTQMIAFILFIAAVALGIQLIRIVQIPFGGGNLVSAFLRPCMVRRFYPDAFLLTTRPPRRCS